MEDPLRRNPRGAAHDTGRAIEAIDRFATHRGFKRRYGYGASMGSYGALQFATQLGLARVFLMGPVASVDPAIDNRWYSDIAAIAREERVLPLTVESLPIDCQTFALYDPRTLDRIHVDHLERLDTARKPGRSP